MFLSPLTYLRPRAALVAVALIGAATALAASPEEAPFLAENDAAMTKMMPSMEITPSGDVDSDFVAMMVPHHQGAIDMALAELRYGRNEQLKRLAQEIIVTQTGNRRRAFRSWRAPAALDARTHPAFDAHAPGALT